MENKSSRDWNDDDADCRVEAMMEGMKQPLMGRADGWNGIIWNGGMPPSNK